MYTKIFTAATLLLLLFGLLGFPSKGVDSLYLGLPVISYLFARKFKLIPRRFYLSYRAILYFIWLIKEILISSLLVIKIIWRRDLNLNPVFEWIEHEQGNDPDIVLYANSITVTPGTVTLDIANNMLLVHALERSSIDNLKITNLKIGSLAMGKRIKRIS
ncbi:Na+/H+ antiporter subunit E [Candidatus Tisiphia endosymbiont of Beris chalybata]|uniref:Na+/H+ antiporter subunit E n=1 Tax=Candidatus Tisiphia endosymbiont of Beris chalybata TaxID=3066262 RepID=UPI00312CBFE5